ncbi:MAG: glycoside hydrolase family 43 protein [Bacteroidales bacterium]|nr:glycoside hydrolase family 43 protein [Bacteroidales bacterium]
MKRILFFTVLQSFFLICKAQENVSVSEIFFADPTVFYENGRYYLTGTQNSQTLGFAVLQSENLKEWSVPDGSQQQMILEKGTRSYGDNGFWAPQIFKTDSLYYLTYTANEQTVIAKSENLTGSYTQDMVEPVDGSEKNIDSYLFRDDDGKYYFYHVRFNRGNFLWVAEFDIHTRKIVPSTLARCFINTEAWETTPNYPSDPIMEGPTVIKLKGKYYMFYSANHFMNIDYAMGYATSDSPMGPWEKHPSNPVIHRLIVGENGSGHGDIFEGPGERLYYVYHVHFSNDQVSPRRTRIVPLSFNFNQEKGIYDISADAGKIIVPVIKK